MRRKSKEKKRQFYQSINDLFDTLNNSKFFAGIMMLIMNIGSKYVTLQLSESQEDYVKYTLGRQVLVFAILWAGTRDIVISLSLALIFILFADYLFNDSSKFCILSEKCKTTVKSYNNKKVTSKDIQNAIDILKQARKNKCANDTSQTQDHHF